jgi:hypothetical protein
MYAYFHENLKMYFKVKCCETNKESNLYIANDTYNQGKLPNRGQNMQKYPLLA